MAESGTFLKRETLEWAAVDAVRLVEADMADWLVVLGSNIEHIPGEQGDDGVRAIAAIDVLRFLVERCERLESGEEA